MSRAWHWWMLLIVVVGLLIGWETGFFHSRVVTLEWEGEPVEFRVLAINHQGGFAVVDLAAGVMRVERFDHRGLPVHSVDVAAFTRSGDLLVHPRHEPALQVVPGGDISAAPAVIRLPGFGKAGADSTYTLGYDVQALGDRSGENIWLLMRTYAGTLVELITKEGAVLAEFELKGSYYAAGLLDNDLIVINQYDRDDLVLKSTGAIDEVTTCRDDIENGNLRVVSVHGHHTACLSDDERHLVLYDVTTGQTDRFTAFESGHWSPIVLPIIPAEVANIAGRHMDQLLLEYLEPDPTNQYSITKAIYAADLSNHTMRWLYDKREGEALSPLGIVDDLLFFSSGVIGEGQAIIAIDLRSGERQTVVELPEGYFIYDAA